MFLRLQNGASLKAQKNEMPTLEECVLLYALSLTIVSLRRQ